MIIFHFSWRLCRIWHGWLIHFQNILFPWLLTPHPCWFSFSGYSSVSPVSSSSSGYPLIIAVLRSPNQNSLHSPLYAFPPGSPIHFWGTSVVWWLLCLYLQLWALYLEPQSSTFSWHRAALPQWLIVPIDHISSKLMAIPSDSDTEAKNLRIRHFLTFLYLFLPMTMSCKYYYSHSDMGKLRLRVV